MSDVRLYYNFQSILKLLCWSCTLLMIILMVQRYRIQRIGIMLRWIFGFTKSDAIIKIMWKMCYLSTDTST